MEGLLEVYYVDILVGVYVHPCEVFVLILMEHITLAALYKGGSASAVSRFWGIFPMPSLLLSTMISVTISLVLTRKAD